MPKEWTTDEGKKVKADGPQELNHDYEEHELSRSQGSPAVYPLPLHEADIAGKFAAMSFAEDTRKGQPIDYFSPLDAYSMTLPNGFEAAHICVDLSLPNDELEKAFKAFLPKYKKLLGIKEMTKLPSKDNFQKALAYKVLPYLDLLIWEQETQQQIKRSKLAIKLFPDGEYGNNEIKRTIHGFSMNMISEAFLKALREKTRRNHSR